MTVLMAAVPIADRPRERLVARGSGQLSDRELLAVLLGSGTRGVSALDLAGELLAEYGGLAALGRSRPEELATRSGMGVAKACAVVAAFELARRIPVATDHRPVLARAADVAAVVQPELAGLRRERVVVVIADGGNRLIRTVTVSEGSIDRALLPVREVLNAVLRHDGRAFALAHNHPSGSTEASEADRAATAEIRVAAKTLGLRFLGHVIVAGREWTSVSADVRMTH